MLRSSLRGPRTFKRAFSSSSAARLTAEGDRLILGIESSCDDSCVALLSAPPSYTASSIASTSQHTLDDITDGQCSSSASGRGRARVLVSKVLRQDHSQTQGIHPLFAQHYHMAAMPLAIEQCLAEGGISPDGREIDGIAVTQGPGMPGCLSVGLTTAKTLAAAWVS
jgi:N6-L-threonylcarbamoyladenine synthase